MLVGAENGEVLTHYPCSLEQRREPKSATDTTIGTPGGCPHRPSGITGENLLDRGVLFRFLVDDHVRLAGLLQKAHPRPGRVNYGPYAEFRAGLLRHIAMEEKILLPAARRLLGGEPLPTYDKLRRDHGALAALLVPTPTPEIAATIRAILNDHNQVEEGPDGVYEVCERLAAEEAESLVTEMRNLPDVKLAPHDDDPRVMKSTLRALERAGYRLEE